MASKACSHISCRRANPFILEDSRRALLCGDAAKAEISTQEVGSQVYHVDDLPRVGQRNKWEVVSMCIGQ